MLCHVKILEPMKRARRPVTKTSSPEEAAAVDVESSSASLARHAPQRLAALPPWLLITYNIFTTTLSPTKSGAQRAIHNALSDK